MVRSYLYMQDQSVSRRTFLWIENLSVLMATAPSDEWPSTKGCHVEAVFFYWSSLTITKVVFLPYPNILLRSSPTFAALTDRLLS